MEVVPVTDEGLGNTSHVIEVDDGEAVVVDPFRDPRPYLRVAEERGWRLRAALETHLHADFVSGGRELAAAVSAEHWVPDHPDLAFSSRRLVGGEEVALGGLTIEALATPGHTPEHLAYVLREHGTARAVLTGGTLIVGGVARPDLLGKELTEPLARQAYQSIHERLLALPDATEVLPTHGAGSFCSAGPSGRRSSTIGAERAGNALLAAPDEDAFVERLLSSLGSYPGFFRRLRAVNAAGPTVYGPQPPLPPELDPDEVDALAGAGAEVVDARSMEAFAAGHVPGALADPLRAQFAVWLGWLVGLDRDVVLVVDEATDVDRAVSEAREVGVERLAGVLPFAAWREAGRPEATIPLLDAERAVAEGRRPLDVRQAAERAGEAVPGAEHVELGAVGEADVDGPVVTHCGHGERAMTAASLLARRGADAAALAGGPGDLAAALDEGAPA